MPRPRLLAVTSSALVIVATAAALAGPSIPALPATATPYPSVSYAATYPVFDNAGRRTGTANWHWTPTGGNPCEVYITATASGGLFEFGGSLPYTSPDAGQTWQQVTFPTPVSSGEGALVVGPGGDVFGIGWDPYSGDHLQGVRYTAATKSWKVAEAPLHTPFFDREWITYAQGPFLDELGNKVPFITLVRGGYPSREVGLIATDGISYTTLSDANADVARSPEPRFFDIRTVANPDSDYWQPHPATYTLPLNAGGVLLMNNDTDDLGADAAWLNPTSLKWERVRLAFRPTGTVRQDSRGWLTMVTRVGNELSLALSSDGGRTWTTTELGLPPSVTKLAGSEDFFDVKVNGVLGQAVVSSRAENKEGLGQDLVWRVDIKRPKPRVMKVYAVGLGDGSSVVGLVDGVQKDRFDFASVAMLPSGRIAVAFQDASPEAEHQPALAILD